MAQCLCIFFRMAYVLLVMPTPQMENILLYLCIGDREQAMKKDCGCGRKRFFVNLLSAITYSHLNAFYVAVKNFLLKIPHSKFIACCENIWVFCSIAHAIRYKGFSYVSNELTSMFSMMLKIQNDSYVRHFAQRQFIFDFWCHLLATSLLFHFLRSVL